MLKKLNERQKEAVTHGEGPLLIIAGAGTGKTTVITERIKYLVSSGMAKPEEIVALTFTEKAALEMQTRVDEIMPYGVTQMSISTFHSFCDQILRAEAINIGLDPKSHLLIDSEALSLMKQNIFNLKLKYFRPLGNPNKFIEALLQHFSRLSDEDVSVANYRMWAKNYKKGAKNKEEKLEALKYEELSQAFEFYYKLKIENSFWDYGDLINKTLYLFRKRRNVLSFYQKKYKYILVDEFQDTNFVQSKLIYLLSQKHKNITVVGDDDQSIYKFRGAAISNILQFRKNYPESKAVVLTENFRSYQQILDSAYKLIQHNNPDRLEVVENINKKLVSSKKIDKKIRVNFIHQSTLGKEAKSISDTIQRLIKKHKYRYSDFAILVRANNHAEAFLRALESDLVPCQFLGPQKLFSNPEILDLIAYLKVLANTNDSLSLYKVLSIEVLEIPIFDTLKLSNNAKAESLSFFEVLEKVKEQDINSDSKEKINKLVTLMKKHIDLSNQRSGGEVLFDFVKEFGLLERLIEKNTLQSESKAKNIIRFFEKIKLFELVQKERSIFQLLDWLDLSSEFGDSQDFEQLDWAENNAVNILTIHSAKGLEFPVVFLVNLVSQRFPSVERKDQIVIPTELIKERLPKGDFHLEEERRLMYVGMTRAKDYLFLTAADYYSDAKRKKSISVFVKEALDELDPLTLPKSDISPFVSSKDETIPDEPVNCPHHKVQSLSYSKIETFKLCPLHYKLKYVYGIQTEVTAAESFGISIHTAIKDFYDLVKSGRKPSEKLLLERLSNNWVSKGYYNKEFQRLNLKRAKKYLKSYFKNTFDSSRMPTLLEYPFSVKLQNSNLQNLKLSGVIDRVDKLPDGRIEIIDYKTSEKVPSQKEVDKNFQLTLYALASINFNVIPFSNNPKDLLLSLYYFENQTKITTTRTVSDLAKAEAEVIDIKNEIENSSFLCSGNYFCKSCEFDKFCRVNA